MDIQKGTAVTPAGVATAEQLEKINALAKAQLTSEQVYVFSLRLCDDQLDRDMERFDTEALPRLAQLFVGKTGIVDHRWTAGNQVARIFDTQVVCEQGVHFIKAWAYIRRGAQSQELIDDIEAGIKKEVSVGCAMGAAVCSVCGAPYGSCGHQKGERYDGNDCHVILREPLDAYEFSFVAVPAQRAAGVLKAAQGAVPTLRQLSEEFGAQAEFRTLSEQAQLGRAYEKQLQNDVVRLMLSLDLGMDEPLVRAMAERLSPLHLQQMKHALSKKFDALFPGTMQLRGAAAHEDADGDYLI